MRRNGGSARTPRKTEFAAHAPLLYLNAYFGDEEGRPVCIGRQYYVGSRYRFES